MYYHVYGMVLIGKRDSSGILSLSEWSSVTKYNVLSVFFYSVWCSILKGGGCLRYILYLYVENKYILSVCICLSLCL